MDVNWGTDDRDFVKTVLACVWMTYQDKIAHPQSCIVGTKYKKSL